MKTKTNQTNKTLGVLIGLNVALILTLISFNWIQKPLDYKITDQNTVQTALILCDSHDIPTIIMNKSQPEVPKEIKLPKITPPEFPEEIEEVKDEEVKVKDITENLIGNNGEMNVKVTVPISKNPFGNFKPSTEKKELIKPDIDEKVDIKTVSPKYVTQMAIYPGCERDRKYKKALKNNDKEEQKKALINCFKKNLQQDLNDELDIETLQDYSSENQKSILKTKLDFIVDENGQIVNIKPRKQGDQILKPEAKKALLKIAKNIQRKGGIQPAKDNEDVIVRLKYSIPLTFQFQN